MTREDACPSPGSQAGRALGAGRAVYYIVFTLHLIFLLDRLIARDQRRMGRGEVVAP